MEGEKYTGINKQVGYKKIGRKNTTKQNKIQISRDK